MSVSLAATDGAYIGNLTRVLELSGEARRLMAAARMLDASIVWCPLLV